MTILPVRLFFVDRSYDSAICDYAIPNWRCFLRFPSYTPATESSLGESFISVKRPELCSFNKEGTFILEPNALKGLILAAPDSHDSSFRGWTFLIPLGWPGSTPLPDEYPLYPPRPFLTSTLDPHPRKLPVRYCRRHTRKKAAALIG